MTMDNQWRDWVKTNLDRGVDPAGMVSILTENGFSQSTIRKEMGAAFPGAAVASPSQQDPAQQDMAHPPIFYKAVAECGLTKRKAPGLKREPTTALQLYIWNDFLTPEECQALIDVSIDRVRPSTITRANGDPFFRTSSTCDLVHVDEPIVTQIDQKIADALGISVAYSEGMQAQKYEVEQEFKAHTDYFEPQTDEFERHARQLGQRTWTFMIYLNTTPKGGATHFTSINRRVKPKAGRAVIWNNLHKDGSVNPATMHHGTPVEEGKKLIITKWFRDRGEGEPFVNEVP